MLDIWSLVKKHIRRRSVNSRRNLSYFEPEWWSNPFFNSKNFIYVISYLDSWLPKFEIFSDPFINFHFFAVKPYHVNIHWNWDITTWNNVFFSKNHQNHNVYALWETKTVNFVKSNLFKHDMEMICLIQFETHEIIVFFVKIIKHELFTVFGNIFWLVIQFNFIKQFFKSN